MAEENSYYKELVTLFEFDTNTGTDKGQDKITETGSDVNQDISDDQLNLDDGLETLGNGDLNDLNDADYMAAEEGLPQEEGFHDVVEVSDKQKQIRLLELFRELLEYSKIFYETLETIDFNLLEKDPTTKLRYSKKKLFDMIEKLESYITDVFYGEQYEKSLYVYILLRTELLTNIKLLRQVLNLDKREKELETEKNKEK